MSVILKNQQSGEIVLLTKGADSIIAEKLRPDQKTNNEIFEKTFENLERYATTGLRTLLLASKKLNEDDYNNWLKLYNVRNRTKLKAF